MKKNDAAKPAVDLTDRPRETKVPLDGLILDPANARTHGPDSIRSIKDSLGIFRQTEAVVVQKSTNKVIAGNGRVEAMREMGATDVWAIVLDVGNTEAAALALAMNRTAERSEWDADAVARQLKAIQDDGFDVSKLGWDESELGELLKVEARELVEPIGEPEPPEDFADFGEDIETQYCCPKCGYEWSGKPK